MFLDFYRLSEQPFGVTPNPAYLYPSRTHCEALAALTNGILESRGFLALIARPGMGKTTLLYELLDELRDSARTVFLFQTQCDSIEFFRYVLTELGIDAQGMNLVAMHSKLNEVLFDEMLKGKRFVMIVDEAQNLDDSVLETVRLLSNFETQHTKLLQIILAGQPQLAGKLANPSLSQLRQRIAVISHLQPLTPAETTSYIDHRLKVAGYRGDPLFTPEALALIAERSEGIPRTINNFCFDALTLGHTRGERAVTAEIVKDALARLDLESIAEKAFPHTAGPSAPASVTVAPPPAKPVVADTTQVETPSLPTDVLKDKSGRVNFSEVPQPAASQLTYPSSVQRSRPDNGIFRGVGLTLIFLLSALYVFPSALRYGREIHVVAAKSSASAIVPQIARASYPADPQNAIAGQVLTVVAGPNQTLKDIGLLYLGRFDDGLLGQISNLNPELKNSTQIKAGQLIRLPLPPGTLTRVDDSASSGSASKPEIKQPLTNTALEAGKPSFNSSSEARALEAQSASK